MCDDARGQDSFQIGVKSKAIWQKILDNPRKRTTSTAAKY